MKIPTQPPWTRGMHTAFYTAMLNPLMPIEPQAEFVGKVFEAISIGTKDGQVAIIPLDESSEENANFVAAAPDLLYALEEFLDTVGKDEYPVTAAIAIRAIKKAKGIK